MSTEHAHTYGGQTVHHSHPGGDTAHGYYGHPEDAPESTERMDYPNEGSAQIPLTLTVTVPEDTSPKDVADALNAALDEPGNYGNDWGNWIVGAVQLAASPARTAELLNAYGRAKFGDEWWPGNPSAYLTAGEAAELTALLNG